MYSGAFFRSSSWVFIGFKSWNLSHSLKFGISLATSYDLSHSDTVLFLTRPTQLDVDESKNVSNDTSIEASASSFAWCNCALGIGGKGIVGLYPCTEEGLHLYQCICIHYAYGQRNVNPRYYRGLVDFT
jgi:hypothetical protein